MYIFGFTYSDLNLQFYTFHLLNDGIKTGYKESVV